MSTSGPGPGGPGPDVSARLEALRRRLYGPGGRDPDVVAEFERLSSIASQQELRQGRLPGGVAEAPSLADPVRLGGAVPAVARPRRRRRRRVLLVAGGLAAVLLVVVAIVSTRPSLPHQVEVPMLAGTTLFAYGRVLDPATGPDSVTYQPEGYTVFQPRGRTVAVALRCVGDGTVRISAGPRFDFRCTGQERTEVQRGAGPRSAPFIVMGTTRGSVVWSARIVLIDPPQTAGAIPSFRDSCADCAVAGARATSADTGAFEDAAPPV